MTSPKKNTSRVNIDIKILLAIIGVSGTIIAALITAVFSFLATKAQVEVPIKATQTSEASLPTITPTTFVQPTVFIKPTEFDWHSIVIVEDARRCTRVIIPNDVDLSDNGVGPELADAYNSGITRSWAQVPYIYDSNLNSADVEFHFTSISNKSWIELSKTVYVSIEVEENIPDFVNVMDPLGCGGGGEVRRFPVVALENSYLQFTTKTNFPDFDFFTLQPGEFEYFIIPFECKTPGYYRLTLSVPFKYDGDEGIIETPTIVVACPQNFTLLELDVPTGTIYGVENYEWNNSDYSRVP